MFIRLAPARTFFQHLDVLSLRSRLLLRFIYFSEADIHLEKNRLKLFLGRWTERVRAREKARGRERRRETKRSETFKLGESECAGQIV